MNIARFTAINYNPKTLISINGKPFECEIQLESNIHAIQFHDTKGHIEFHDKPNQDISSIEEIPDLQNLIQSWQTTHDNETDRPETYYNKSNFHETKKFKIAETPDETKYTLHKPLDNESYQKLTANGWIVDSDAKELHEKKVRIAELKQLLAESDFRMTTDYFASMSESQQDHWINLRHDWREELRGLNNE